MLTGHRYRVILYFAVLVLCLSVCFAFAEDSPTVDHESAVLTSTSAVAAPVVSSATESVHFLYYSAPGRASFLPALSRKLITEPKAAVVEVASADTILQQFGAQSDRHRNLRSLFSGRHHPKLVKTYTQEQQTSVFTNASQLTSEE